MSWRRERGPCYDSDAPLQAKIGSGRRLSSGGAISARMAGRAETGGDDESVLDGRGGRVTHRGRVFVLFRSGLGLVFLAAFLSLAVQLPDLVGRRGLLPWADFLARPGRDHAGRLALALSCPTLYLLYHGDPAFL